MTDLLTADVHELRARILRDTTLTELRDEIVRQARAQWERELAEVKRQAAWDALTAYADDRRDWPLGRAFIANFRDTHYAPTPRSVTLSDGSVVTPPQNGGDLWKRDWTYHGPRSQYHTDWWQLLNELNSGADWDTLKAFAASVEAK